MQFFSFFLPAFDVQQSKNKEARGQKEHFVFWRVVIKCVSM